MRGQVFSMAFLVFHVSVKCSIPPFQVYSVILSVLCTVLLFTFERHGSFLNSFKFLPFFLILDNSIFTLHIIFLCIVVKICYKTSYMAPSVADILYFSASRMCLNYLLLTTVVRPTRSFTAYLWLHLLNWYSDWVWRNFNGYSLLLIAGEQFIPPSKERLRRHSAIFNCFHSHSVCSRPKSCHTAPFPIYTVGWQACWNRVRFSSTEFFFPPKIEYAHKSRQRECMLKMKINSLHSTQRNQ